MTDFKKLADDCGREIEEIEDNIKTMEEILKFFDKDFKKEELTGKEEDFLVEMLQFSINDETELKEQLQRESEAYRKEAQKNKNIGNGL